MNQPPNLTLAGLPPGKAAMAEECDLLPNRRVAPAVAAIPQPGSHPAGARTRSWTNLFDPRQPEAFLAFCSLWCAMQMGIWPDEFAAANALVTREIGLRGHERVWAIFAIVAALLKLVGLASRLSARWQGLSEGMVASGLFMSIVFWMIVGLSRVMDFPHSLMPVALTGLGMAAAFQLAERRDPRETWR